MVRDTQCLPHTLDSSALRNVMPVTPDTASRGFYPVGCVRERMVYIPGESVDASARGDKGVNARTDPRA